MQCVDSLLFSTVTWYFQAHGLSCKNLEDNGPAGVQRAQETKRVLIILRVSPSAENALQVGHLMSAQVDESGLQLFDDLPLERRSGIHIECAQAARNCGLWRETVCEVKEIVDFIYRLLLFQGEWNDVHLTTISPRLNFSVSKHACD